MLTRRKVLLGAVAVAVSAAIACRGQVIVNGSSVVTSGGNPVVQTDGLYPNAAPAFLPMRQVYPAPSGVESYEPHLVAYFDAANNTAHGCHYRKRIVVSFGRWPFRYELVSGPPGMTIVSTYWQTAWDCQGDMAVQEGYGVIDWVPTAAISSGSPSLVSVNVIDQDNNVLNIQWYIHTAGDITQTGGVFFFLNADSGSDTTGTGGWAAPWQSLAYSWGTGTTGGAAPAQSICVLMGATALYSFPQTSGTNFTWNTNHPICLAGFYGETASIDCSQSTDGTLNGYPAGCRIENITYSGCDTTRTNFRYISGATPTRMSLESVQLVNSGSGEQPLSSNSAPVFISGGAPSYGQYVSITGMRETNRASSTSANSNTGLWDLYNTSDFCGEFNYENSPGNAICGCASIKSDVSYACLRGNLLVAGSATQPFSAYQNPYKTTNNCEVRYNTCVVGELVWMSGVASYSWGTLDCSRNNFILSTSGIDPVSNTFNLVSPYTSASANPYGINPAAPSVNSSGGTLSGGPYFYCVDALGVTGETQAFDSGSGGSNEVTSGTLSGSTNAVTFGWYNDPYASGYRIWRGTSSEGENQYTDVAAGVTSFTDNGSVSWTSGTPPSSNTAVSAQRFYINSNVVQTPASLPSGADVVTDAYNQYASSGMLDTTTGLLTSAWRAANPSLVGYVGAQLA